MTVENSGVFAQGERTAERAEDNPPRGRSRLRWPVHIVAPVAVIASVGALLAVSAGSALRPARSVTVRPVVFVEQPAPSEPAPREDEHTRAPQSGGRAVQAPGWLEADPFSVAATALADGVVEEILVLEGERVEKDEVVARLVAQDAELALARAEADLNAASAVAAVAEAVLAAARTDWENPVERERAVGVAQAQLAETAAELAQLPSLIAAGVAEFARMQEEANRAASAQQRGGASDIEVIILQKRAEAQAASVEALRRREAILDARRDRQQSELRAAERAFELRVMERRAVDASTAELEHARAAEARARAARDEAALRLERMTIRAPMAGLVQRRFKAPGDKVMLGMDDPTSAQIVLLYDPSRLQARVDVPLADAAHISVGQACEVVVEVLPDRTFRGEVTRITHEADLQKNTLQVKVRLVDPAPVLKPEMLTRVKFLPRGSDSGVAGSSGDGAVAGSGDRRVRVALDCIASDGSTVWTVRQRQRERGVATPVPVSVLEEAEQWAVVSGALHPGDLAIVEPASLRAGERVRVTASEPRKGGAS